MSAVEEIQAAIDKLTKFNARGYWIDNGWLVESDDTITWPDDPRRPLTDDDYIVTLHRTIDAQLALLTDATRFTTIFKGEVRLRDDIGEYALDLARAINGTV